jgi:hypothetical protein
MHALALAGLIMGCSVTGVKPKVQAGWEGGRHLPVCVCEATHGRWEPPWYTSNSKQWIGK